MRGFLLCRIPLLSPFESKREHKNSKMICFVETQEIVSLVLLTYAISSLLLYVLIEGIWDA
jgi:hypothetical protein